jgi:hypothetical protein
MIPCPHYCSTVLLSAAGARTLPRRLATTAPFLKMLQLLRRWKIVMLGKINNNQF